MNASGSHARDYYEAEVRQLMRALRGYGVLTRDRLYEAAGAESWNTGTFDGALAAAVRAGEIKRLDGDLYELPEDSS